MNNKLIKYLYLIAIGLNITMYGMNQQQQINWDKLPIELKSYILSLIPAGTSMSEIMETLKDSSKVSKEFRSLTKNLLFNNQAVGNLAKEYLENFPIDAMHELVCLIKDRNKCAIKALIDNGMDVNNKELGSYTYLMLAIDTNDVEIVRMLLDADAAVNAQTIHGLSVLIVAIKKPGISIEIVRMLLDAGANVNITSFDHSTALMYASDKYVAELLLERGANPDAQNFWLSTALILAVGACNKDMVALLLSHNANSSIPNSSGKTALMIAEELSQYRDDESLREIIQLLKNHK